MTTAMKDRVVLDYAMGLGLKRIGRKRGCAAATVRRLLTEAGVPIRKVGSSPGSTHPAWTGGRIMSDQGYVLVKLPPEDSLFSMTNNNWYVAEHRLVMARSLGRPLVLTETVHHINGDRQDNRLENLQLRQGKHGSGVRMVCADCGSHNVTYDVLGAVT